MRALAPASYDAHLFTLEVGRASCLFARTLTRPVIVVFVSQNKIRQLDKERGENILCY